MVKSCLPNTTRTKPSLDPKQRTTLKQFREDNSIVILSADKGNMTVVMKRNGYRGKMEEIMSDGSCMSLKKDPTCKLERQLNELMKDLERNIQ